MAVIGLTVNNNSTEIQKILVEDSINTTRMVRLTARIERRLYQSLIYLSAIKETEESQVGSLTLDAPNQEMLEKSFIDEIGYIHQNLFVLENLFSSELEGVEENSLDVFRERFEFYEKLSLDWLVHRKEDPRTSTMVYNTSISPYFRNNIIPVINSLREQAVDKQIERSKDLRSQVIENKEDTIVISVIFILISIAIGYYLYLHIANPLRILTKNAQRLGDGYLDTRLNVTRKDEIGQLGETFNTMASNLKKRTMARDYLDNIIESIQETLIVTDENDVIVGINKAAQTLLGFTKEELLGKHVFYVYRDSDVHLGMDEEIHDQEVYEFTLRSKTGDLIPVLFSQSELINANKEMVGKVYVATDITQQKRANERIRKSLKEKDVLLAEIHHRVKNNLAVVSGILQLQSYATENKEVMLALKESQSRIKSISLVHEGLYHSDSVSAIAFDKYVADLLKMIHEMYFHPDKKVNVQLNMVPFSLDVNKAIPCSLLLNEIVMNSYEFSEDGNSDKDISIAIKKNKDLIEMHIEDDGPEYSMESEDGHKPLELTLIETLTQQLEGTYTIQKPNPQGRRSVRVEFNLN